MAYISFSVGRIYCRSIRDYLEDCKFRGMRIEYLESSGWIVRDFTIKGDTKDIEIIQRTIELWAEEIERSIDERKSS